MAYFVMTGQGRAGRKSLTSFRNPDKFLLPGRCPQLARFFEVIPLLKLPLSEVATEKGLAVLVDAVAEVLTGHAETGSYPALKVSVIDKSPFLHGNLLQYA